ncbi:MAG: radical SAM protein [Clostridiales bacterium]|nr:radical SAM protein [Clostridiales bacterium]
MKEIQKKDKLLAKLLPGQKPRPGVVYRPSQFAVQAGGRVWNTLTQQCLETALPQSARAGEGYDDLIRDYMLVPMDKDECRFYEGISAMMRAYNRKPGCFGYTILPTLGCNARCVYCYEQGMVQTRMSGETVAQVIRFILDTHAEDDVALSWFGGEPLLCPDIIDTITAALGEAGLRYHSSMISNGSLITPRIVEKMTGAWKLGSIQISMDGAERDYVARKRYLSGSDHYRAVIENIRRMAESGIRVAIRCNVDFDNWDGVPEMLLDMKELLPDKRNVQFYFAPLNAVRAGDDEAAMWERIVSAAPLLEDAGFTPMGWLVRSGPFQIFHCMADGGSVVIAPDGCLYPCEHCPPEARFGDIWRGVTDEAARRDFCRADRTREQCRGCSYLPLCTSFASCPVRDAHCRAIRDMEVQTFLPRMRPMEGGQDEVTIC